MAEGDSTQEPTPPADPKLPVEQGNNKARLLIRGYLTSGANRHFEIARRLGPWLIDDNNRKIFIEEWSRAVQSAKSFQQLQSVTALAWDVNQNMELSSYLKSRIRTAKPELKDKDFSVTTINSEYDGIRRAVGEKLKTLGLTNSGIKGPINLAVDLDYIFNLMHPNPHEEYTYTATRMETRGKVFKKQVEVSTQEHGYRRRPFEQLITELLQYNQPQPTPTAPTV